MTTCLVMVRPTKPQNKPSRNSQKLNAKQATRTNIPDKVSDLCDLFIVHIMAERPVGRKGEDGQYEPPEIRVRRNFVSFFTNWAFSGLYPLAKGRRGSLG
jgi:hypothetical protein